MRRKIVYIDHVIHHPLSNRAWENNLFWFPRVTPAHSALFMKWKLIYGDRRSRLQFYLFAFHSILVVFGWHSRYFFVSLYRDRKLRFLKLTKLKMEFLNRKTWNVNQCCVITWIAFCVCYHDLVNAFVPIIFFDAVEWTRNRQHRLVCTIVDKSHDLWFERLVFSIRNKSLGALFFGFWRIISMHTDVELMKNIVCWFLVPYLTDKKSLKCVWNVRQTTTHAIQNCMTNPCTDRNQSVAN